jgi:hypothetical protein
LDQVLKREKIQPLTDIDISKLANDLGITNFRGVFMKDKLPQKINEVECGIINLELSDKNGSLWTAYYKNYDKNIISTLMVVLVLRNNLLNICVQKIYFTMKMMFKIIMIRRFVTT